VAVTEYLSIHHDLMLLVDYRDRVAALYHSVAAGHLRTFVIDDVAFYRLSLAEHK
jgi:hypothetical protein